MKVRAVSAGLVFVAFSLFATLTTHASQIIALDFATLPGGDNQYFADFGNGFTMTAIAHYDVYDNRLLLHGNCCANYSVRFEYNDGELFDFLQVENSSGYWFDITASNGMSAVFEQDYGVKTFGEQWTNLTWVTIGSRNNTYIQDPVFSVAAVPVPAGAWLFGSSLGLLYWLRRKLV